jgi:formate/nitrite transporter FocA (FNT family)
MLLVTYVGCAAGTALMAWLAAAGKLACLPAIKAIAANKINLALPTVFARSVGGGMLICLAILTSRQSPTMTGKAINIVFPISAYVSCYTIVLPFFSCCEVAVSLIHLLLPASIL